MNTSHPLFAGAPALQQFRKLRKRLVQKVHAATEPFSMVERGAPPLVCLSGGKNCYKSLAILYELQRRGLLPVELLKS